MQTRPIQLALARALTLLTALSAGACADAAPDGAGGDLLSEAALVQQRGEPEASALVRDDFERGTVAAPTWQKTGDVRVRVDAARTGAFGVQLGRRAALITRLDTRGRRDLTLRFDARAVDLERGEVLRVELSIGGRWYVPIARIRDASWETRTVRLSPLADDRDDVRVRFVVVASDDFGREQSFEGVLIDNVEVIQGTGASDDDDDDDALPAR